MSGTIAGFNVFDVVGIVGVALYLSSYAALQFGFMRGQGYAYAGVNGAAASCVLISLVQSFNLSSVLIQVFWIIISIVGITRIYLIRRRLRFTPEERDLLMTVLPDMPRERARELLNIGQWITGDAAHVLTIEGEPVPQLAYLTEGEASVVSGGRMVALIKKENFIGEITCINGEAATATVALTRPSLVFCIEAGLLRDFLARKPEVRDHLEIAFSRALRNKLVVLNKAVSQSSVFAVNERGAA